MEKIFRVRAQWIAVAVAALLTSACSLDKQQMPALSGPSGLALSIAMSATPDSLPRDGSSQSVVTLTAIDFSGGPVAGLHLSLSFATNPPAGAVLSTNEVVTGSTGKATFTVTAPISGSLGDIAINAVPVGNDANNARVRTITIVALPSNNAPPVFPCTQLSTPCAMAFSVSPA